MTTTAAKAVAGSPDAGDGTVFPCSSSQRRCWFIDALRPGTPILNIALRWEITGLFNPATIEAAFQGVIDRHEVLRSRFFEQDGEPVQEVCPRMAFKLSQIDLSIVPEAIRVEEALALARREAKIPFSLDKLPLIRVTLVRVAADRAFLLVTVHQIAFDGASIALLAHEFGAIAEALETRCEPKVPDLPLQYGDYARWQTAFYESRGFEAEIDYWREQLAGAPYFEIPSDFPRPETASAQGDIVANTISPEAGRAFEDKARAQQVTLFSFAFAATVATLHRLTGETDIVVGTQIVSRDHPDLEPLIGVFLNNLVLRVDASADPDFEELVRRSNRIVQDALIHQQMPFDRLVGILNPPRDPTRTPLISINFTVLHEVLREGTYGSFNLRGHPSLSPGSLYDFNFFVVRWPSGWRLGLEFNPLLFERATAELILATWCEVVERAIAGDNFRLSTLPAVERAPTVGLPNDGDLADLQAALLRHPLVAEAVAVGRRGPDGYRLAQAYIVPAPDCRTPLDELPVLLLGDLSRDETVRRLPDAVSVLWSLPRTASGAVNTRALPAPSPASVRGSAPPEAPSALEGELGAIWQELLGVDTIAPDANFFELGGHSLLAVRMVTRIAKQLGRDIEVVALFNAPTLRAFAHYVSQSRPAAADWQIVPIQPAGSKLPIIALNNTVIYYNLARRIDRARPFLGIQLFDPSSPRALAPRRLEDIAADYVELIRRARPTGPYILCGLCVAGAIAYEVAQQLRRAGEDVALVIMADTWVPGHRRGLPIVRRVLAAWSYRLRAAMHKVGAVRSGKASAAEMLQTYGLIRRSRLLPLAAWLGLVARVPDGQKDWGNRWFLPHLEAARDGYRPAPFDGDVLVLQSDEVDLNFADPRMGWGDLVTGRLEVKRIPGWHTEIFQDEGAALIAEHLTPLLARADEAPETVACRRRP